MKRRYNFDEVNEKISITFVPTEGETLLGYSTRIVALSSELRERLHNHTAWYTHYGAGPCSICDLLAFVDYLSSMCVDIAKFDKKKSFVAHKNGTDPLAWEFTPAKLA